MTPAQALSVVAGISIAAYIIELIVRRRSSHALRELAAQWRMNFGPVDSLRLTPKVARHFPVPGAANLRVANVIYGTDADRYRYVFTVEYTVGVIRAKKRLLRVGAFSEPRDREHGRPATVVVLADDDRTLVEQYRALTPPGLMPVHPTDRQGPESPAHRDRDSTAPPPGQTQAPC